MCSAYLLLVIVLFNKSYQIRFCCIGEILFFVINILIDALLGFILLLLKKKKRSNIYFYVKRSTFQYRSVEHIKKTYSYIK